MAERLPVDPASVLDAASRLLASFNARIEGFHGLVANDVTLSSMGLPIARVNSASGARFDPQRAAARINDVIAWFEAIGVPFSWEVGPRDRPRALGRLLQARGFKADHEQVPVMAASVASLPSVELPAGGSLEVVRDGSAYREWVGVVREGFGMPAAIAEAVLRYEQLGFGDDLPDRLVLGRLDGRPVATAMGAVAGGGVTIVNVTTLEEVRGRGFGRAVTLETMRLGRDLGARIAVLESTEMGFSVYSRLGFETFARYRYYVWDPT